MLGGSTTRELSLQVYCGVLCILLYFSIFLNNVKKQLKKKKSHMTKDNNIKPEEPRP